MVWRSGRTYSEDLRARAGGSGRWQRGAILQGQYFRCLQGACAAAGRSASRRHAEKRTSRPQVRLRPRFQDRPCNLLADFVEWPKSGPGMDRASQPGERLRPPMASRSEKHLLQCPAGSRGCCIYHAAINTRLRAPITRAVLDRTASGNFPHHFTPSCGLEAQLDHVPTRDKLLKLHVRL